MSRASRSAKKVYHVLMDSIMGGSRPPETELGVGLNRKCRFCGFMLDDEGVFGSCHILDKS
ncbi:MAG: hypothetical protein VB071_03810 [Lawsonibacter sp.]|nr:hypothetical protein [Lawsonibacter sp.]